MGSTLKHTTKWLFGLIYFLGSCAETKKTVPAVESQKHDIKSYRLSSEDDLNILLGEIGNAKIALLGEASHGTAEYYTWRAAISKKLITAKGFNFIAVEGDHIDLYRLNQCITGESKDTSILHVLSGFDRWPQWLWGNEEFARFAEWIKEWNARLPAHKEVKVCGLDVFNFAGALHELLTVVSDSTALHHAKRAQNCLTAFGDDALRYSSAISKGSLGCKQEVYGLWNAIQKINRGTIDNEKQFSLIRHALVVLNGEQYFRLRNSDAAGSWNTRVRHMQEIIRGLIQFYGSDAKLIVWAHNTHIGDARYTDMPTRRRTNIGELLRKEYGEKNVFSVGFGSSSGETIAGYTWGAPLSKIKIRPAKEGSWEHLLHMDGAYNKIVLSKDIINNARLKTWIQQRAIGVVYSETYTPSIIPMRYNAFIYFDTTHAIHAIQH